MLDECYNIIHGVDSNRDLTLKYYAQKVYYYLNTKINFDSMWGEVSNLAGEENAPLSHSRCWTSASSVRFDYLCALYTIAESIPTTDRVDKASVHENLGVLYEAVEERIKQYSPAILKKNLRAHDDLTSENKTWIYTLSECAFLMKQVHDVVVHELGFVVSHDSVYKGYKYCIDKVLKAKVGDYKIIMALQAHLAQYFGISTEMHENSKGQWKIYYNVTEGNISTYQCPKCYEKMTNDAKEGSLRKETSRKRQLGIHKEHSSRCKARKFGPSSPVKDFSSSIGESSSTSLSDAAATTSSSTQEQQQQQREEEEKSKVLHELSFHRSILESLVTHFAKNLKNEWRLAGGPTVYNLLSEDTFATSMRDIFSAWRHVEHWKIAQLRHYMLLLNRVSNDPTLKGGCGV